MPHRKTILVASLNWGLGHATRCIPIIRALLEKNFEVLLASDGQALLLLQKEFPQLPSVVLPSYNISYPKDGRAFKWSLLAQSTHIFPMINRERKAVEALVAHHTINGIISDGRLGVYHKNVPSVYLTHQLNVLSGVTSLVSSKLHQWIIKKFDCCWVPDVENDQFNLSGKLGHLRNKPFPIAYIGPVSRLKKEESIPALDWLILLSGPEPQRTYLENILIKSFSKHPGKVILVRGVVEEKQNWERSHHLTIVNFLESAELGRILGQSNYVIARSGYSTAMDLALFGKKAFFIPTPGQYEQEYLAYHFESMGWAPFCHQKDFSLQKLASVHNYRGFGNCFKNDTDFSSLFALFQSEGEF